MTTFVQIEYHQSFKKKKIYCYLRKDRIEGRDDFLAGSFLIFLYDNVILNEETPHNKDLKQNAIIFYLNLVKIFPTTINQ